MIVTPVLLWAASSSGWGQSIRPTQIAQDAESDRPSSFSSFNERIARYYSAAVKGNILSSQDGAFELNASIYGLRSIFHPESDIDTLLLANGLQRNVNLGLEAGMGDSAKVDRIGGKIRWAFLNRRDRLAHNFGEDLRPLFNGLLETMHAADSGYIAYLEGNLGKGTGPYKVFYDQYTASQKRYTASQDPKDLDPVFYKRYGSGIQASIARIREAGDSIAAEIDKRLLATLEFSGGYRIGESGYWGLVLEAYRGVGDRGEVKATAGYRITDSASTWSSYRWELPLGVGYNFALTKTSEDPIELTAMAVTAFSGIAGTGWSHGHLANTYGLGIALPIKKGFSLPLLVKNDSFTAWHGTASVELSLNVDPD